MTFKGTSEFAHFHDRTGSHSTKGHGSGRVDVLPPEAKPWAEIYLSIREQREIVLKQVAAAEAQYHEKRDRLRHTMARVEYDRTMQALLTWERKVQALKERSGELKRDAMHAARNALGSCFMVAAHAMLTGEQFAAVLESAQDILSDDDLMKFLVANAQGGQRAGQKGENEEERRRARVLALRPDSHRGQREAEKAAKYGNGKPKRADGPDLVVAHKEF